MKRKLIDTSLERQILTGMIISDQFLREVLPLFSLDLLEIKFGPIIANWCKTHQARYNKAPGKLIQEIYEAWNRTNPNEEQAKYIGDFLATLSDEFVHGEKFNAEYLIDKTVQYFKLRSFKLLAEDINYCLENNDTGEAEKVLGEFKKIERLISPGIDPYNDLEAIRKSFSENKEPLFIVPGALGHLMNEEFTRDSFIILLGPEKRGKSWWLQYFGMVAHRCQCNVAEFQVGDMSEDKRVRRQQISLAKRSDKPKYCGELLIPLQDCENNQKNLCNDRNRACDFGIYEDGQPLKFEEAEGYRPCTNCLGRRGNYKGALWHYKRPPVKPLTWREAYQISQEYQKKIRPKGYRLSTHSMSSINVEGIERQLDLWERLDGFIPDVVIIDYKDILAPEKGGLKEKRDQSNETSKAMRKLSQDRHICLISATQADAASYYQPSLTKSNFSEDKRILGHVTAMFALNQTIDEKRQGLMRIGSLVIRDDGFDEAYNVHVGCCLEIGQPYLFSW